MNIKPVAQSCASESIDISDGETHLFINVANYFFCYREARTFC